MVSNHRIVTNGDDWMRDVERRVGRQERRPAPVDVNAVFGPGVNRNARQIADWNDPEALRNGWYYTEAFGIHSPDPDIMWMGQCIVTHDGHGTQQVWSHGDPVQYIYTRTFHWHDHEAPDFGPWIQLEPTPTTGWINLTYQNSWFTYSPDYGQAAYEVRDGVTYLQGLVQQNSSGLANSTVAFLPPGTQPQVHRIFQQSSGGGPVSLYVMSTGQVYFPGNTYWGTWLSISCSFPADH